MGALHSKPEGTPFSQHANISVAQLSLNERDDPQHIPTEQTPRGIPKAATDALRVGSTPSQTDVVPVLQDPGPVHLGQNHLRSEEERPRGGSAAENCGTAGIISVSGDFLSLNHMPLPATEQLVALLQALGQAAIKMTRNKHKMYSILGRSRDICSYILAAYENPGDPERSGFQTETILDAMEKAYTLIYAMEEILLELARLLPAELETLGPKSFLSWSQSRATLINTWNHLGRPPFDAIPFRCSVSFADSSYFDDCAWISRLLHEVIEPKILSQFPEDEGNPASVISTTEGLLALEYSIKSLRLTGVLRDIVIDIATILAITLSGTASVAGEKVNTPE
ncbi:hypothetical protein FRC01_003951, partial [Tulasnella sp. 417]